MGTKATLDVVLNSESGGEILTFLRSRGPRAYFVGPERVRVRVLSGMPAGNPLAWAERPEDIPEGDDEKVNFIVLADDAAQERAALAALRKRKGSKAYGLFSQVVPALLCAANGMARGLPTREIKRYAIVCIPRSGSRYLSAVLANRGVGVPKEHMRESLADIMAKGNLGFPRAFEALEKFGQANGIFGTKVISTFLIRASHGRMREVRDNVFWLAERGYKVMRLERPLQDVAISSYIAYQMKRWHFFGEMDEAARARLDSLNYDDGAAWEEYIRYRAEKAIIDAVTAELGAPTISYTEFESDIDGIVSRLCGLIGVDPQSLPTRPAKMPIPVPARGGSDTYRRYGERLAELLDRRAGEVDSETARRVCALADLPREAAERLVAGLR